MEKYVKLKKIGEGSFGKAYLVKAKANGKQYVIKEINMAKMSRKERDEAKKETALLAQMQHPNIVTYKESFEETGSLYIVMDYCDGGDLYGRISAQRGALLPEEQVLDWFVQICLSIKHIHDRKILHRDIKTQNIFLTKAGIVKLGDFGIAKVLNSTVELARTCIGTPYYLSPEICENKPYNNKSDIWSLGCVLYELTTLKHAFEAGNMKNLVLKIIRGSYPPVPPRYSYELRNLLAQLFKRNPRDRPSVTTILKKPFIQKRIQKFLSETMLQEEFSHTVMHGQRMLKQLPPPGQAKRAVSAPVARKPPVAGGAPARYDPAAAYAPAARRSKENRRSAEEKKKPNPVGMVPAAAANNANVLAQKRKELMEKEQKRREAAKKQEQMYARQHRELIEKQRMDRIKKAREAGWKNMVNSLGSENAEDKKKGDDAPSEAPAPAPAPAPAVAPAQAWGPAVGPKAAVDRGNYEGYNAYLEKLKKDREERAKGQMKPDQGAVPGRPMEGWPDRDAVKREFNKAAGAAQRGEADRALGAEAAEKAKQVSEFLQRKKEAAYYKNRGQAMLFGREPDVPAPAPHGEKRPISAVEGARNQDESEYLARLRQIRLQNFNERKMIKQKIQEGQKPRIPGDPRYDPEARKQKIEALKAQADARAKKLKEELEMKRRAAFEREKKQWDNHLAAKGIGAPNARQEADDRPIKPSRPLPKPAYDPSQIKPAQPIGLTGVMKAIGAEAPKVEPSQPQAPPIGMTNVMKAIGAAVPHREPSRPQATPIGMTNVLRAIGANVEDAPAEESVPVDDDVRGSQQEQKKEILRKLNQNPPDEKEKDRPKWGAPATDQPMFAEQKERPQWGQGDAAKLRDMALQETASNMDATSAQDLVFKAADAGRKQWGGPAGTAINVLNKAAIVSQTMTIQGSDYPDDARAGRSPMKSPKASIPKGAIGETIVIPKQPPQVVGEQGENKPLTPKKETPIEEEQKSPRKTEPKSPRQQEPKSPRQPEVTPSEPVAGDVEIELTLEKVSPVKLKSPDKQKTSPAKSPRPKSAEKTSPEKPSGEKDQGKKKLFDQVELDEEEEATMREMYEQQLLDNKEEEEDTDFKMASAGVIIGLATGHFDIPEAGLLRTCSMPDLSKLFRTNLMENPFFYEQEPLTASMQVMVGTEEEDIEEVDLDDEEENVDDDDVELEDDMKSPEALNLEEEEELRSMRESLARILRGEKEPKKQSPKKKASPRKAKAETDSTEDDVETIDTNEDGATGDIVGTIDPVREAWESDDDDDEDENSENDIDDADAEGKEHKVKHKHTEEEEEEEEDIFSRLEESRIQLEEELGCDTFLKAYQTVQAIHEDEDENIEDGQKIVTTILGHSKEHLYPKILQLVMADGAFVEDND
ncbi:serine/threonine-protein kinase Nek1 isoform X2 [Lingula anatina]|uniref:non-specific serine/threonine protein kinase n=1 Tax=Lingula anatina TaxID=7574 RepID=A0A1S3JVZ5_LINAN|nr:serine/threonine-protein kinase Nek1 isoform X2 [Lingula anatina]|eukprot:XP_013414231.1 serine/threonine-protein kinase Nek1 isoform X2 [Lingula anatina]